MIIIIDFGSQTAHLIGRRLRDMSIDIKILDAGTPISSISELKPNGIIFSGGPSSVYEKDAPSIDPKIFNLGIPILGICYGWQLTAYLLKGKVVGSHKEYGPGNIKINNSEPLFSHLESYSKVWLSHGDTVLKLPKGFEIIAETESVKAAACADFKRNIFGVQFHPEVEHTVGGTDILKNFAEKICKLKTKEHKIDINSLIEKVVDQVGKEKIICAVSGGVDSTVAAYLIGKAVGKNLYPIYIESGLMRVGTKESVLKIFKESLHINPIIVEAKKIFLQKLKGVTDGETKRKIIGKLYIELFEKEAKKIKDVHFLAQGTIYSDVIESKGTKHASKIKSHHNVGGLPEEMNMTIIEPLRYFYKDEVRKIGKMVGLPSDVVQKQVFPGPGQAIRIVGEVTPVRLEMQQLADKIVVEEIVSAGLYYDVYMSFSILTNTFSTAVKGDARQLLEVVALRIIESSDVMTTDWAKIPYEILQRISSRIVNEVAGVSRVVYDITTKPPATMEWE